jgi:hypothetical protein
VDQNEWMQVFGWSQNQLNSKKRKVLITAFRENATLSAGKELAKRCTLTNFEITESHEEAEVILYLEYGYVGLSELPRLIHCVGGAPSAMHFLFSEADWPFPILPGAYPSLYKPCPWAHSWCYLPKSDVGNSELNISISEPRFLFSFLGRTSTHPLRKTILTLDSENSPCLDIADASQRFPAFDYSKTYWAMIADSKFVLCPRGFGASSIRIFEVMSLGRVPVIISDQWRQSPGIPWKEVCVFVPEKDISSIPAMLRQLEGDSRTMGKLAQEAFNEFFAPSVFFDRLLMSMVSNYSDYEFAIGSNLSRAWRALGWREIRSFGSQTKSRAIDSLRRLAER